MSSSLLKPQTGSLLLRGATLQCHSFGSCFSQSESFASSAMTLARRLGISNARDWPIEAFRFVKATRRRVSVMAGLSDGSIDSEHVFVQANTLGEQGSFLRMYLLN